MDVAQVLSVSLHTIAFVIAWGYYGVLGRIVLPGLARSLDRRAQGAALEAIERRALPLVGLSVGLFVVTGSYLLVTDTSYAGLGNVFASSWTVLMLVKHVLIGVLVVVAIAIDRLIRRLAAASTDHEREAGFRLLGWSTEGATAIGALIVLLTAAAQAV
jgi:uncharacterized membrane protein